MEFTFCSFTYNQESLILQHLESIKYQINHYGDNISCDYLLCDDCSKDKTVEIVQKWLENNRVLFRNINIIVQEKNRGIVRNFETALKNIHTHYFKILAGDDFFYKHNIFSIYGNSNMVATPLLNVTTDGRVTEGDYTFIRRLIMCSDSSENIKSFACRQYKYGSAGFLAPGVFITRDLVDEGLFKALEPYDWIEDVPEFTYLISQKKTNIKILSTPLVVYRTEVGISSSKNKNTSDRLMNDRLNLKNNIHTRYITTPKAACPFYYMKGLDCGINKLLGLTLRNKRSQLKEFNATIRKEQQEANEYIESIIELADNDLTSI